MLKNGKIDTKVYIEQLYSGSIGFEGLHFFLFRMHHSFILIDILWKIMLTHDREHEVFKYIFEVVINQLFEEYIFVRTVFKNLEERFHEHTNENWIVDFLYFYDHFIWKNKKFIEMYDKYNWFFKNHLIKFPAIYHIDEVGTKILNDRLIECREMVDKRKHFINNKQSYRELSKISVGYFKQIAASEQSDDKEWLVFSRKSVLNKLEVELIQKRVVVEDKVYVGDYGFDSENNLSDGDKDTKHSLSEKL